MGIAGSKLAVGWRVDGVLLDCHEKCWHCLLETSAGEVCSADHVERKANSGAGAQTQRGLDVLDRDAGLAGKKPQCAADIPAAGKAGVERQRSVNKGHHGADILAKIG